MAHLIEHAQIFEQAQRLIKWQQPCERTQSQPLGMLRHRAQEQIGRGRRRQRRAVVFGQHIGIEPEAIGTLKYPQPLIVGSGEATARFIEPVEQGKPHALRCRTHNPMPPIA